MKILIATLLTLLFAAKLYADEVNELKTRMNELDERLTDIELNDLKQRINLGLDLKVMSNYFKSQDNQDVTAPSKQSGTTHAVLFRLNLDAKISHELKAFASFESYNFFNDSFLTSMDSTIYPDNRDTERTNERPRVIKAYFDWELLPKTLTFSAGRLPTVQGPPTHLINGTDRTGTYPIQAYSVPFDGFAGTLHLTGLFPRLEKHEMTLRAIYHPGTNVNPDFPWRKTSVGLEAAPQTIAKNHEVFSTMFEYEYHDLPSAFKNLSLITQYGEYRFGGMKPTTKTISYAGSPVIAVFTSDSDRLVNIQSLFQYAQVEKVLGSDFDFYASVTRTKATNKANLLMEVVGVSGSQQRVGSFLVEGKKTGWRYNVGTRYSLIESLFAGAEVAHSSADAVMTGLWADDVFSIHYINGTSYHAYLTKLFYKNQFTIRTGYVTTQMNKDLEGNLFYKNTKEKIQTVYLNFLIHI